MTLFDPKTGAWLVLALGLAACAEPPPVTDLGPMKYDASGTLSCSAGAPTYDQACGWRVLRKPEGAAEIWVSNIASQTKPAYRVLYFARGEFLTRDGDPLQVSKEADTWSVAVEGREFYRFPDALVTGG